MTNLWNLKKIKSAKRLIEMNKYKMSKKLYNTSVSQLAADHRTSSLLIHAKNDYAHSSNKCFEWFIIFHNLIWGTTSVFIIVTIFSLLSVWFMQYKNYHDYVRTTLVRSTTCTNPQLKFRTCKSNTEYAHPWLLICTLFSFSGDICILIQSWRIVPENV